MKELEPIEILDDLNLFLSILPSKIKKYIEEAILNGEIDNTYDAALGFLLKNKEKFL